MFLAKSVQTDSGWSKEIEVGISSSEEEVFTFFSTLPLTGRAGAGRKQRVQAQNRLLQKGGHHLFSMPTGKQKWL